MQAAGQAAVKLIEPLTLGLGTTYLYSICTTFSNAPADRSQAGGASDACTILRKPQDTLHAGARAVHSSQQLVSPQQVGRSKRNRWAHSLTELHHGVGDLAAPQRRQALEQAAHALLLHKLGQAVGDAARVAGHRLHLDLHREDRGGTEQQGEATAGRRASARRNCLQLTATAACSTSRLEAR